MSQLVGDVVASVGEEWRAAEERLKQAKAQTVFAAADADAGGVRCWVSSAYLWGVFAASLLSLLFPFCLPATASSPARILIINAWDDTMPAAVRATTAIREAFAESPLKNAEIYYDTLDLSRFSDKAHEERMARLLSEKYVEKRPDVIIALGRVALGYLLKHRGSIAPGVPIIVCYWAGATPATVSSMSNVTGVFSEFNWSKTFDLAARLQPEAREVAIVSGASISVWEDEARKQLAAQLAPYKVRSLIGLPYDALLQEVARLPRDTIVLVLPIFKDGDGVSRIPAIAAGAVARSSNAPSYAPIDTFLGAGIVGGYMNTFEATGVATARLALEVFERKGATELPPPVTTPHNFVVDARELQRWRLSQSSLPAGTQIMFRQPTLWEQYRDLVIIAGCVFALLVACLVGLSLQVLKRKRAEATLEASEQRMKFSAAATETGLWQYDIATGHVWATEYCRFMFGLDAASPLTPESFLSVVHPDDRAVPIAAMRGTAHATATTGLCEFPVVRPNMDVRWYLATTNTEFDRGGKPARVSGIFRDITARKQAEQEAERLERALRGMQKELGRVSRQTTVGAMAASIAHEINQPLSALVTNGGIGLRLLANANSDFDEVRDVLKRIIDDGHRASAIITGIRAMFKKDPRELKPVSIHELVSEVLSLVHADLESQRISLCVELHKELPCLLADRVQLQQVLLNLIMNAAESMGSLQDRERSLCVKSEPLGEGDVLITVEDSGPGIDTDDVERVFDAFFTTKPNGMGLGLSICRLIIQGHGGCLWASARMPYGAIFHIQLPGNTSVQREVCT